jgi:nucleoside-diphosphate-sugar epimerase
MRILVTGGTSFVGAPLVRSLLESGHEVRALVREESRFDRIEGTKCRLAAGDIRDAHAVSRAAFGCDSVIHLAYAPVSAEPREIMDTAVTGMSNVLRACELHGVRDLMLVSSPRAGNGTYYGHGKQTTELMAAAYLRAGVFDRVTVARIFNAYGPDMGDSHVIPQFVTRMLSWRPGELRLPVLGSGRDRRSFVWIGDCTAQLAKIYESGGSASYDVGDPRYEVAIGDLAEMIGAILELKVTVVPDAPCTSATVQVPSRPKMIEQIPPQVDLPEGLARTVDWYKKRASESTAAPK